MSSLPKQLGAAHRRALATRAVPRTKSFSIQARTGSAPSRSLHACASASLSWSGSSLRSTRLAFSSSPALHPSQPPSSCSSRPFASPASSSNPDGSINFNLADIGEGIQECELIRWFVKPGDQIAQFDKVCEVQSDKANVEITSRFDGQVKELKYEVGQLAHVGKPLLTILPKGAVPKQAEQGRDDLAAAVADAVSSSPAFTSPSSLSPSTAASFDSSSKVLTSPAVRRIAREESVDLSLIQGTGPGGRILKEDVQSFVAKRTRGGDSLASLSLASLSPASASLSAASSASSSFSALPLSSPSALPAFVPSDYPQTDRPVPVTGLARIMVQTMTASNAAPQLGFSDEINMNLLSSLRAQLKPLAEKKGVRLTYLAFLVKAVSLALRDFPQLNAHTNADCSMLTHRSSHNIGIAMDTPRGLLVPNIKNVQSKSVLEIAAEIQRLAQLGQVGKLGREDLQGGTFTLSNIGTIGGTYLKPILVLPEVVIGGIGSVKTLPRFDENMAVIPTKVLYMSWSADHRVVDGATMARFSNLFKDYVEDPSSMLLATR